MKREDRSALNKRSTAENFPFKRLRKCQRWENLNNNGARGILEILVDSFFHESNNCLKFQLIIFFCPFSPSTQVNIDIEDINDNFPTFESSTVRISVPENVELGTPLYVVSASDRDSGKSGTVAYRLSNGGSILSSNANLVTSNSIPSVMTSNNLFSIDSGTGHLTLSQHLDFETSQRHSLIVTATDSGEPPLSSNLTIFVEVQDVNDNLPIFERNEYTIKALESTPINSQVSAYWVLICKENYI